MLKNRYAKNTYGPKCQNTHGPKLWLLDTWGWASALGPGRRRPPSLVPHTSPAAAAQTGAAPPGSAVWVLQSSCCPTAAELRLAKLDC